MYAVIETALCLESEHCTCIDEGWEEFTAAERLLTGLDLNIKFLAIALSSRFIRGSLTLTPSENNNLTSATLWFERSRAVL